MLIVRKMATRQSVPRRVRPEYAGRSAYTVLDLIVSLGAVLIVAGLLGPAVQSARESSRRLSCISNMHQIGLAMNNYVVDYNCFPPCNLAGARHYGSNHPSPAATNCFSPFTRLLPQLEQPNVYNSTNFTLLPDFGPGLAANHSAMSTTVETFLCPSDYAPRVPGYGRMNYRYSIGPTTRLNGSKRSTYGVSSKTVGGAFATYLTLSSADFVDGLSCTVGVSERRQGDWTKGVFLLGGDYRLGELWYQTVTAAEAVSICRVIASNEANAVESRGGESWFISGFQFSAYNHCSTPNTGSTDCSFVGDVSTIHGRFMVDGVFSASSNHPSGVNVLSMDGSVRFASNNVNLAVWQAISTRAGGEAVSSNY